MLLLLSSLPLACSDDKPPFESVDHGDASADGAVAAPDAAPVMAEVAATAPADVTSDIAPDAGSAAVDGSLATGFDAEPALDAQGTLDSAPGMDLSPKLGTYGVVVLPDTQYYASSYNDVFYAQTQWIAAQKPLLNMAAVLHVGDIVDTDNADQWRVARTAMNTLDAAQIPYVLVPGNHDYSDVNRTTMMDSYFGPATMPWITGTMVPGQMENNYALIDIGPRQWLVIGLEFGPRDAVVKWADAVLSAYPDRPAMIVTHAYLYQDGTRYDLAVSGMDSSKPNYQSFIPQFYGYTASQGINDGEQIYQKLVLPHPNVRMVFSGHDTGAARLASTRPDGSTVYQMLSDYQWYNFDASNYDGGGGYLRLLQLDYDAKQVTVRTYSPYLASYLTDEQNQFVFELD